MCDNEIISSYQRNRSVYTKTNAQQEIGHPSIGAIRGMYEVVKYGDYVDRLGEHLQLSESE